MNNKDLPINDLDIDSISEAIEKDIEQLLNSQYQSVLDDTQPNKLTDSPHEIMFDVTAHVMEENTKGEIVGTKQICTKKYHIPVPIDQDYHLFMSAFFSHVENCLSQSIEKTSNNESSNE